MSDSLQPMSFDELTAEADKRGMVLIPAPLLHSILGPFPSQSTWAQALDLWARQVMRTRTSILRKS